MNPKLLSEINSFIASDRKVMAIKGKAGTGKTQIIKEITQYLREKKTVSVVTPTNKAAGVLRARGIPATTIYKILYKSTQLHDPVTKEPLTKTVSKPIMDPANPKEFLKDANGEFVYHTTIENVYAHEFNEDKLLTEVFDELVQYSDTGKPYVTEHVKAVFANLVANSFVLVIDEASMINAAMWKNLVEKSSFKIIAVGDVNQLLPVETTRKDLEDRIKNYDVHSDNKYTPEELYEQLLAEDKLQKEYGNYFISKLPADWECRTIHRTKSADIVSVFESLLKNPNATFPINYCVEDAQCIAKTDPILTEDAVDDLLLKADIVIAWKNETVKRLNTRIRELKYPMIFSVLKATKGILPMITPGEPLYVSKGIRDDDGNTRIASGEIIRIVTPEKDYNNRIDSLKALLWADVQVDSTGEVVTNVPLDLSFLGYKFSRRTGIDICKVDFGYAITCNKAQGSQWPWVLVWDEVRMDVGTARKWRYTAVTRAQELLTVIVL